MAYYQRCFFCIRGIEDKKVEDAIKKYVWSGNEFLKYKVWFHNGDTEGTVDIVKTCFLDIRRNFKKVADYLQKSGIHVFIFDEYNHHASYYLGRDEDIDEDEHWCLGCI